MWASVLSHNHAEKNTENANFKMHDAYARCFFFFFFFFFFQHVTWRKNNTIIECLFGNIAALFAIIWHFKAIITDSKNKRSPFVLRKTSSNVQSNFLEVVINHYERNGRSW